MYHWVCVGVCGCVMQGCSQGSTQNIKLGGSKLLRILGEPGGMLPENLGVNILNLVKFYCDAIEY